MQSSNEFNFRHDTVTKQSKPKPKEDAKSLTKEVRHLAKLLHQAQE